MRLACVCLCVCMALTSGCASSRHPAPWGVVPDTWRVDFERKWELLGVWAREPTRHMDELAAVYREEQTRSPAHANKARDLLIRALNHEVARVLAGGESTLKAGQHLDWLEAYAPPVGDGRVFGPDYEPIAAATLDTRAHRVLEVELVRLMASWSVASSPASRLSFRKRARLAGRDRHPALADALAVVAREEAEVVAEARRAIAADDWPAVWRAWTVLAEDDATGEGERARAWLLERFAALDDSDWGRIAVWGLVLGTPEARSRAARVVPPIALEAAPGAAGCVAPECGKLVVKKSCRSLLASLDLAPLGSPVAVSATCALDHRDITEDRVIEKAKGWWQVERVCDGFGCRDTRVWVPGADRVGPVVVGKIDVLELELAGDGVRERVSLDLRPRTGAAIAREDAQVVVERARAFARRLHAMPRRVTPHREHDPALTAAAAAHAAAGREEEALQAWIRDALETGAPASDFSTWLPKRYPIDAFTLLSALRHR